MKKAIIEITVNDDYGSYGEDGCEGCPFTNNETDECGLDNYGVSFGCPKLVKEDINDNEIIKKIDAEIFQSGKMVSVNGETFVSLDDVRKIILSEQKEPCEGCRYNTEKEEDENGYCQYCQRAYTDEYQPQEDTNE